MARTVVLECRGRCCGGDVYSAPHGDCGRALLWQPAPTSGFLTDSVRLIFTWTDWGRVSGVHRIRSGWRGEGVRAHREQFWSGNIDPCDHCILANARRQR